MQKNGEGNGAQVEAGNDGQVQARVCVCFRKKLMLARSLINDGRECIGAVPERLCVGAQSAAGIRGQFPSSSRSKNPE